MSEISNLYVLKVLSEKIQDIIFDYKKKILNDKNIINLVNNLEIDKKEKLKINTNLKLPFEFNEINENYNDYDLGVIQIIINSFIIIKQTLIDSTKDLNAIFNFSFQFLKDKNGNKININLELYQKEQFNNIILDETVLSLINKVKNLKNLETLNECINPALGESNKFIEIIEYNINKRKEEEKKLVVEVETRMNLGEIVSINDNTYNNLNNNGTKENTLNSDNIILRREKIVSKFIENIKRKEIINNNNHNYLNKTFSTQKINYNSNDTKGKDNYDLDQWISYIEDDDNKKKSKKKKNKKSKNKNKENNFSQNNEITEDDKEINLIKKSLLDNSCNKYSIRKLKPNISQDWIKKNIVD